MTVYLLVQLSGNVVLHASSRTLSLDIQGTKHQVNVYELRTIQDCLSLANVASTDDLHDMAIGTDRFDK